MLRLDRPAYSESLVKFANENLAWLSSMEKLLIEFVQKKDVQTLYLPTSKPRNNRYLESYATFFGLDAVIVDEERGQGNVIVRKKETSTLPTAFLSSLAKEYTPDMYPKCDPISSVLKYFGQPIPVLFFESIKLGIESRDIFLLLEPFFGMDIALSQKWLSEEGSTDELAGEDVIITISGYKNGGKMDMETILEHLARVESDIKERFVLVNKFAVDIRVCWYTKDGEVVRERPVAEKEEMKDPQLVRVEDGPEFTGMNPFEVLEVDDWEAPKKRKRKPKKKVSVGEEDVEEAIEESNEAQSPADLHDVESKQREDNEESPERAD